MHVVVIRNKLIIPQAITKPRTKHENVFYSVPFTVIKYSIGCFSSAKKYNPYHLH